MDTLAQTALGRALIGDSLGFHILLAALCTGLPVLIAICEALGLITKDALWLRTARSWSRVLAVLLISTSISAVVIALQLAVVWPKFMAVAGAAVGVAGVGAAVAFLVQGAGLAWYLTTWDQLAGWRHWVLSLPVIIGALGAAFFVTCVNTFMNAPQGLTYNDGVLVATRPVEALINPATTTETSHSLVAYIVLTAGVMGSWYAWRWWRRTAFRTNHHFRVIQMSMVTMLFGAVSLLFSGHASVAYLAQHEPVKLAAAAGLFVTQASAPLQIGGWIIGETVRGGWQVPGGLSWLAFGDSDAFVQGLDLVPAAAWPPAGVFYSFTAMAVLGIALVIIPIIWLLTAQRAQRWRRPWPLWLVMLAGPAAVAAVELGWIVNELGRQPYAITGTLLTSDAMSPTVGLARAAVIFPLLYIGLLAATAWALTALYRRPVSNHEIRRKP